jgi:hypothetical protein
VIFLTDFTLRIDIGSPESIGAERLGPLCIFFGRRWKSANRRRILVRSPGYNDALLSSIGKEPKGRRSPAFELFEH